MTRLRASLPWLLLGAIIGWAVLEAATSPLLQWRQGVYIAAALAGVIGLAVMPLQAGLAKGQVPGLSLWRGRRVHRWLGAALLVAVLVHVGGLWITSPPDVIDALLWRSPTPFAPWGVVAMWALLAAAVLAALRKNVPLKVWKVGHAALVCAGAIGTVVHALLIEGTMGVLSKTLLCAVTVFAALVVLRGAVRILRN